MAAATSKAPLRCLRPDNIAGYTRAAALALAWLKQTGLTVSVVEAFKQCGYEFSVPFSDHEQWFLESTEVVQVVQVYGDRFDEVWVRARMPFETSTCSVYNKATLVAHLRRIWPKGMCIGRSKKTLQWPYPGAQEDCKDPRNRITLIERLPEHHTTLFYDDMKAARMPETLQGLWHNALAAKKHTPPSSERSAPPGLVAWVDPSKKGKRARKEEKVSIEELMRRQREQHRHMILVAPDKKKARDKKAKTHKK